MRHLEVKVAFREDDTVVTEGGDGVYPPGIPIGALVKSDGDDFEVRAHVALDRISTAVILVDDAARQARSQSALEHAR